MKQYYSLTLDVPDGVEDFEAQDRVLQNFPDRVAGIEITRVEIVAGLVDRDGAPAGPTVRALERKR